MKKILFATLLLLSAYTMRAQEVYSRPFAEDNKVWLYQHLDFPWRYQWEYYTQGDTIISGQDCFRVFRHDDYKDVTDEYVGAIYDEGKKSYIFLPNEDDARLFFDFGVSENDTLLLGSDSVVVTRDSLVDMPEGRFRFLFMTNESRSYEDKYGGDSSTGVWIEGIGSSAPYFLYPVGWSGYDHRSLCACFVDGDQVFAFSYYIPNPSGVPLPSASVTRGSTVVYDLQGRQIQSDGHLPRGVYIRDGRKFIVK